MQTFLPYVDFKHCARVLDRQRLGKQRVECKQILDALHGRSKGWASHPAVLMWRGYERALLDYAFATTFEWAHRGYEDNMRAILNGCYMALISAPYRRPQWLGDQRVHGSHRAALLYKMPEHYRQFRWKDEAKLNYFWPVTTGQAGSSARVIVQSASNQ